MASHGPTIPALGLLVVLTVAGPACDDKASDKDENAQRTEAFAAVARRYSVMRAATPSSIGADASPCPDEAIAKNAKGGRPLLAVTEYEVLARFDAPGTDPWSGERARYRRLTTPAFAAIDPPAPGASSKAWIDALFKTKKLEEEYSYLGVLRTVKDVPPRLEGEAFTPGSFEGVVAVFEIGREKPMCMAKVSAVSSGELVGTSKQARTTVMWNDYVGNIKTALRDSVRSISKVLVPDLE